MTVRETWRVDGTDLAVTVAGDGPLVVLVHGFPDLAITWRLQIATLVAAGYRVVAPDMRGYGGSERPAESSAYSARVIGRDLIGLLDHEGVERAHVVGHDWGAACTWQFGLDYPDRLLSLTGLSVPYVLPPPKAPTEILRARYGEDFYQLRFQESETAAELDRDVLRTLTAAFGDRFEDLGVTAPAATPDWLPNEVLDTYVAAFKKTGFTSGLAYYRNIDRNWQDAQAREQRRIECPSLFITGSSDPVARFMRVDSSTEAFADLRVEVIEGAGHWVHQQEPVLVNRLLLTHLGRADY
ncbi:alpha/beta fold hydrolase [Streptomyces malaysiensis]|uniref:alpha/beta fold hydrolase n=1 Tax=Streptomyces malaysiensis TaxID=92644 RepID=UPI00370FDAD9